jgi:hypothetical protein
MSFTLPLYRGSASARDALTLSQFSDIGKRSVPACAELITTWMTQYPFSYCSSLTLLGTTSCYKIGRRRTILSGSFLFRLRPLWLTFFFVWLQQTSSSLFEDFADGVMEREWRRTKQRLETIVRGVQPCLAGLDLDVYHRSTDWQNEESAYLFPTCFLLLIQDSGWSIVTLRGAITRKIWWG